MMRTGTIALGALLLWVGAAQAQTRDITGVWLTAERDAAVEVFACGERRCGRVVWTQLGAGAAQPLRDERNPNAALRSRPICRLQILSGLSRQADGSWGGGTIYDPEDGRSYSLTAAVEGDALRVTGYVGTPLLGETQRWTRAPAGQPRCG